MRRRLKLLFPLAAALMALALGGSLALAGRMAAPAAAQLAPDQVPLFDTRVDLEVTADAVFGVERPTGWTGNIDVNTLGFVIDLWVDNEILADSIFGAGVRPTGWLGAGVGAPSTVTLARNVRGDLELSADAFFGPGVRPAEWRGAAPIVRCGRALQNTLTMLDRFYGIRTTTPESSLDYCRAVLIEVEQTLIDLSFDRPGLNGQRPDPIALLSAARGDLERAADELLGLNVRPEGYSEEPNREPLSSGFKDAFARDLTALADFQFGFGQRPAGWIVIIPPPADDFAAALYFRRNLELFAAAALEPRFGAGFRPTGWQANGLERCDVATRALVPLVVDNYDFIVDDFDPAAADYCAQIDLAVNNVVENPPVIDVVDSPQERRLLAESQFAFAYLDAGATQYMGVMPGGTEFRAVYRNYGQSRMMFVSSTRFALFVDYRFTSLPEEIFNNLPTIEGQSLAPFCDDVWCNGPGPTPTPTGFGPLIAVLVQSTPVATPDTGSLQTVKRLVSWNFIRVTYLQDNLSTRSAQVTLEICTQQASNPDNSCQPVISIFDNAAGVPRPILGQANGLNIYELNYGYTSTLLIEGETLYSNDVWISDPTIR
jgi:hypothetical protein